MTHALCLCLATLLSMLLVLQTAVEMTTTEFGTKYNQVIPITGANGKTIDVTFGWIKNPAGEVKLVTGIPTKQ